MEKIQTESEKVEQLMRPRYKLIADYPGCSFEVGTILEPNDEGELYSKSAGYSWTVSRIMLKDVKKFKHLIRPLEWYEERTPEEMPEYVKYAENGMVAKVDHFDLETTSAWFMYLEGGVHPYCPGGSALENTNWIPATLADYLAYTQPSPLNQEK